jgi:uncharacterized protein YndB with AHSA1/START domain
MGKTQTLKFKRAIQASPAVLYRALTNATALREWFCDTAIFEAQKGGRVFLGWNDGYYATGEVTKLNPGRKLAFTWLGRGEPDSTHVTISLAEKKAGATVTIEHEAVGAGKKWGDTVKAMTSGWERALENLQSVHETGEDLRLTLRPMLGISGLSDLSPEDKERLKVPVDRGVRIDGTVAGMGAEAAGLQKDDVLVSIGRQKVWNFPTLASALQRHRAGDQVEVVYYRGGEKQAAEMVLSRRPLPEIPATAAELAEHVRQRYAADDAALAQALEGITEAEAEFRPGPNDWSAKEVLAHLVIGERDGHSFYAELVAGEERPFAAFTGNSHLRTRATAQAYPDLAALFEELRRNEAETVAILAGLPDEFLASKRSYWRVAFAQLQTISHTQEHIPQIQAAATAARNASQPAGAG